MKSEPVSMHADYECMVGDKRKNKLIASAGLGVTGAFKGTKWTVDWKPGELVDEARAQKLCEVYRQAYAESSELECQSVKLLRIYSS